MTPELGVDTAHDDQYQKKPELAPAQTASSGLTTSAPSVLLLFTRSCLADRLLTGMAIIVSCLQGATVPIANWLLGYTFNKFTDYALDPNGADNKDAFRRGVGISSLAFLSLALGAAILEWAVVCLWTLNGERLVRATSSNILQSLQTNSIPWFDRKTEGSAGLMSRFSADLEDIRAGSNQNLGHVLQYLVAFFSTLILALVKSWSLSLVILASIPVVVLVTVITDVKGRPLMTLERDAHSESATAMASTFLNIKTVKAFGGNAIESERFSTSVARACQYYSRLQYVWAARQGLCQFLLLSMFVQGFWFGTYLVQHGRADSGTVLTVFWSCVTAATFLQQCMPLTIYLSKGRIALARVLTALDSDHDNDSSPANLLSIKPDLDSKGIIELQDISFAYPTRPEHKVLEHVSIFIPSGEITYLVGASGSGKSTIGQLLLRMYEPTTGKIIMDDQHQSRLSLQWVRQQIAYVQQDSVLFEDTIFNNIVIGSHQSSDDPRAVHKACKVALIHEFIRDLPNGYDTMLGSGSVTLSGGQKQRIALARALYSNKPLLILDEATSALDSTTRELVHEAVRLQRAGQTTLIITHDLSQVGPDSFVYMLEDGKVIEQGYRMHMMRNDQSRFRLLAELQSKSGKNTEQVMRPSEARAASEVISSANLTSALPVPFLRPLCLLRPESTVLPVQDAEKLMIPEIQILDEKGASALHRRTQAYRRAPQPAGTSGSMHAAGHPPDLKLGVLYARQIKSPGFMLLGLFASVGNGAITPTFSFLLAQLLSNLSYTSGGEAIRTAHSSHSASFWSALVLAVAAADGFTAFARYLFFELASARWVQRLRKAAFGLIMKQDQQWFDDPKNEIAQLTTVVMKDSENMRAILGQQLGGIVTVVVMITIGVLWALITGWELTLAGLALAPCYAVVTILQGRLALKVEAENKQASDQVAVRIYELVAGFRTIRAMSLEATFAQKIQEHIETAYRKAALNALTIGSGQALSEFLQYSGRAFLFYIGMVLIVTGRYDLNKMLQVFALISFAIVTASTIITTLPGFSKGRRAAIDLYRLLTLPSSSDEDLGSRQVISEGNICFESIKFSYKQADRKVLNDLTFDVKAGEVVALVGKSGCGKSTLGALLQRFYHTQDGHIRIDGYLVESYAVSSLRAQIGVISQNVALFDMSIAMNISYGLDQTSLSFLNTQKAHLQDIDYCQEGGVIYEAARRAQILPWILSLPQQFQTCLGQDLLFKMSGGQAQRLQLARLFLRMPLIKVLILDECTSALDSANNQAILKELWGAGYTEKACARPSILLITHDIDAMKQADRVVVLEAGRAVEDGPYTLLMDRKSPGSLRQLIQAGEWTGSRNP